MDQEFNKLPLAIKQAIDKLQLRFGTDPKVAENKKKILREFPGTGNDEIALKLALFDSFETQDFLKKRFFDIITAFDVDGRFVTLNEIIHKGKRVCVMRGVLHNDVDKKRNLPAIVKWYGSEKKDTSFEVDIYKRLREMGAKIPWFSSRFFIWKSAALVMEPMENLTKNDNPAEVAAQVLEQLMYLHKFATHSDLKPGNIMRVSDKLPNRSQTATKEKNGKPEYRIIDFGGCATERLKHGFRRRCWTPRFKSQASHAENQVTTAKHDFIEMGYTWKGLENLKTGEKEVRGDFKGKLAKFMQRVKKVDEKDVKPEDYQDLIKICRE